MEDQYLRLAEYRAGDGRSLFLTAGERETSLADQCLETFGKPGDVFSQSGHFGGPFDLRPFSIVNAEGDVLGEYITEQKSFLRNIADRRTQLRQRIVANGHAVNQHRVLGRFNNA